MRRRWWRGSGGHRRGHEPLDAPSPPLAAPNPYEALARYRKAVRIVAGIVSGAQVGRTFDLTSTLDRHRLCRLVNVKPPSVETWDAVADVLRDWSDVMQRVHADVQPPRATGPSV